MSKHKQSRPTFAVTSTIIIAMSILLSVGAVVWFILLNPAATMFSFNWYAILSFLPLIVNIWIIIFIRKLRSRSEESVWFVLYLCALSIACLGEGLQRLSTNPEAASYWFQLNGIGYALLPMAYYLFVFSYVRPLRLQSTLLIPSILCGAAFMLFHFQATELIFLYDPSKFMLMPWGYIIPSGPGFIVFVVWLELLLVSAVVTLFRFRRRSTNILEKQQAKIYIWAVLIPLVGGSITDAILPLLGYAHILPTSLFLSTCTSVVAFYGLRKFRSFQVNPAEFAGNVISTMHEAVVVTQEDYTIQFVNQEAERLLGKSDSSILGTSLKDRFDETSWQLMILPGQMDATLDKKSMLDRLHLKDVHGRRVPVRVEKSSVDVGLPAESLIFIITDITDITDSYHQLQESTAHIAVQNSELQDNKVMMERLLQEAQSLHRQLKDEKANVEHTVEVRTAELREARDKLKASDELKSEFIMLSSHNLRTPLTIMDTSLELLVSNQDTLSQEQKKIVEILSEGVERLGKFVEDLLTIATLEAGDELSRTSTTIGEIIYPLIDETRQMAMSKGLTFTNQIEAAGSVIEVNPLRLRGAIRNVLHNAVKFTNKGNINLAVSADASAIRIEVKDSGIGIKAEEVLNLFQKFHRGTSTLVYDYQGKGIGLYLTKLVIDEHGGTITVDSKLGEGSVFTIEIPRTRADNKPQD